MHTLQVSEHVTERAAMEYIFYAVRGNEQFETRNVCGFEVEFTKSVGNEWLVRVIAPNKERTVVAAAFVDSMDN